MGVAEASARRLPVGSGRVRRLADSVLVLRLGTGVRSTRPVCLDPELPASSGSLRRSTMQWWMRASKEAPRISRPTMVRQTRLATVVAEDSVEGLVGTTTITTNGVDGR